MVYTNVRDGDDMSKNKISIILYAFMACMVFVIIVLAVKVATKPKKLVVDQTVEVQKPEPSIPVNQGSVEVAEDEDMPDEDIPDDTASTEPETIKKKMVVLKDPAVYVFVRSKPSTSGDKLGQIKEKDQFEYVTGIDQEWTTIKYGDSEAYVASEYVKVIEVEMSAD